MVAALAAVRSGRALAGGRESALLSAAQATDEGLWLPYLADEFRPRLARGLG